MVRRFSSLFFRQSSPSQERVAQAATDNVHAGPSRPGATLNPTQRTDLLPRSIRHIKSSGALLGTLRSLQYDTQPLPPLPTQPARGLGELQEGFWLEDNLHRTASQLNHCSNQLDNMQGSAAEVRQELEGLQVELELLKKKMQVGSTGEEPQSEPPKPVEVIPKRPAPVQATSIRQRIQFFSKLAST